MNHKTPIISILILTLATCGCTSVLSPDVYVHENHPDERLILSYDNTYVVHQADTFGGDYRIIEGDLYLLSAFGSCKLTRDRDSWIDQDGDRWTKE